MATVDPKICGIPLFNLFMTLLDNINTNPPAGCIVGMSCLYETNWTDVEDIFIGGLKHISWKFKINTSNERLSDSLDTNKF